MTTKRNSIIIFLFLFELVLGQETRIIYPERYTDLNFNCYISDPEPKDLRLFSLFHETLFEHEGSGAKYTPNFTHTSKSSDGEYMYVSMEDRENLPEGSGAQFIMRLPKEGTFPYYFHNNEVVSSNDILASIHYAIENGKLDNNLFQKDNVYIDNQNSIRISFKQQLIKSTIIEHLALVFILPQKTIEMIKDKPEEYKKNPIGSGPFKYSKIVRSTSDTDKKGYYLDFFESPNLRTPRNFDGILIKEISLPTKMVEELERKTVNLIIDIPQTLVPGFGGYSIFNKIERISGTVFWIDHTNPHLKKKKFRQAIAYSIQRRKILSSKYFGSGEILEGAFPRLSNYYVNLKSENYVEYDPQKAKSLLSGMEGYSYKGDRLFYKGNRVKLVIARPQDLQKEAEVLNSIENDLEYVGIHLSGGSDPWDHSNYEKLIKNPAAWDLYYMRSYLSPADDLYEFYHSSGNRNYQHYQKKEIDEGYENLKKTVDKIYKKEAGNEIYRMLHEDVASIYLWTIYKWYGYDSRKIDSSMENMIDPEVIFGTPHRWRPTVE
jgi:ABC-type transport system substrate-binding protein